jgi:hypothetical protein
MTDFLRPAYAQLTCDDLHLLLDLDLMRLDERITDEDQMAGPGPRHRRHRPAVKEAEAVRALPGPIIAIVVVATSTFGRKWWPIAISSSIAVMLERDQQ